MYSYCGHPYGKTCYIDDEFMVTSGILYEVFKYKWLIWHKICSGIY